MIGKALENIGGGHDLASVSAAARRATKLSGMSGAPVTSVVCLQDGVLTCGADGAVRFHGLARERLM